MFLAPIALFAYKRPDHLSRTVNALMLDPLASKSDLYIFSDAPKNPQDESSVEEVRRFIRTISGFRKIILIERDVNFGLANSVIEGVGKLCRDYGRVIVLEDDLVVAPSFLRFMNESLELYQDEPSVYQISGYMYPIEYSKNNDAFFLPMISCWGWATWQRAWTFFDPSLAGLEKIKTSRELRKKFNLNGAYDYLNMAKQQFDGKIDSWGISWHLSVFMQNGLVLYPRVSLVQNIGVDASGTHGKGHLDLQRPLSVNNFSVNDYKYPESIECNDYVLNLVTKTLFRMRPIFPIRLIKRLLNEKNN